MMKASCWGVGRGRGRYDERDGKQRKQRNVGDVTEREGTAFEAQIEVVGRSALLEGKCSQKSSGESGW